MSGAITAGKQNRTGSRLSRHNAAKTIRIQDSDLDRSPSEAEGKILANQVVSAINLFFFGWKLHSPLNYKNNISNSGKASKVRAKCEEHKACWFALHPGESDWRGRCLWAPERDDCAQERNCKASFNLRDYFGTWRPNPEGMCKKQRVLHEHWAPNLDQGMQVLLDRIQRN